MNLKAPKPTIIGVVCCEESEVAIRGPDRLLDKAGT